ncbi:hypothetical protein [Entomospira culicis]|uniref:Uncharacterized protein n=1 Tax=Entomospira culicis TaxID=2719989 RepID=A0A968KV02_9SPIO|nr:hypothetical protein [Entomospira culicis]NIZ19885.1 hypothetical protein [Entomospira culicis]NIZ70099.1 hypothetical protein [Entomospira culicis]WDI37203.1 hypothetical protein PVA46_07740 [Entomospira culicis]WDI38832.1 hypothetical protein PVA47_07750 [Entomospira culicis]
MNNKQCWLLLMLTALCISCKPAINPPTPENPLLPVPTPNPEGSPGNPTPSDFTLTIQRPFFPEDVLLIFKPNTKFYLRYLIIPKRVAQDFKENPQQYIPTIEGWSDTNAYGSFNYLDIPNSPGHFIFLDDALIHLDFTDVTHPTVSVAQQDGTLRLDRTPLLRGDEVLYDFTAWSVQNKDVADLNRLFPKLNIDAQEEFHLLFAVRTSVYPSRYIYFVRQINWDTFENITFVMGE